MKGYRYKVVVGRFPITDKMVDVFSVVSGHVENCCLLERLRNAKDYIPLKLDMEDYYKIKDAEEDKKNDRNN